MSSRRDPAATAPPAARAAALREVLADKGLVPEGFLEGVVEQYQQEWTDRNGARVVARAWTDAEYRRRLLADGTAACAELGYSGVQGEYIVVLEDTPLLHNVVVCTQCSCTAWPVLGLPPDWYKRPEYRSRVVREPRRVLHELGLDLPASVAIRVWDTTAETRYMVLPLRPSGTEGWSEDQLAAIVTREAMIGVALVHAPHSARRS
ncbi:MAG: nitrile hydratase subunit alpha [Candidatus Binatia bacterium]